MFAEGMLCWNSLASSIRSSRTLESFQKHLKTRLFQSAFDNPSSSFALDDYGIFVFFTYLLDDPAE